MGLADSLKREIGRAIRSLARSPGFTLIVIITLALGIGATTAIFTMLDRVVLHALPYADSDRLVWLDSPTPGIKADERWAVSVAGYFYFKDNARTLQSVGVLLPTHITVTGKQAAERVPAELASGSDYDVLKLRPMLGRVIQESDNRPHAAPVAVLGYNYWKTRLNSNPGVVGSTMIIGTAPHQIVGVMGPDAGIPNPSASNVDLWLPAQLDPSAQAENSHYLNVVARLAPEATAASAQAELAQFTK
jgi:putative ABC transport system permease protein